MYESLTNLMFKMAEGENQFVRPSLLCALGISFDALLIDKNKILKAP